MSFAEKILKKYGWKEGDGLGKNNDGIAKPLKASLKFDNAGLGVDKADEFNNHWWERVYNEAADNVQIEKDGDKIAVKVKNDESVEITTKDYSVRKMKQKKRDCYENFLLSATLTNTGDEITKPDKIKVDDIKVASYKPLTDEALFAACGGRTAHKGARHGLNLSGKLARIEQQEKELLRKMQGKTSEPSQTWTLVKAKKSKKIKVKSNEIQDTAPTDDDLKLNNMLFTTEYYVKSKKKRKEKKKTDDELSERLHSFSIENSINKGEPLVGICDNSKVIKKSKKGNKFKKRENTDDWESYREPVVNNETTSKETETDGTIRPNDDVDMKDLAGEPKRKKSKKCKHGIDKEAKETYKQLKKIKKNMQRATKKLENVVLSRS